MTTISRPPVFTITIVQTGVLLSVSVALWWWNTVAAYSVLLGGCIAILPNAYLALHAFRYRGARSAHSIVQSFYRGEIGKYCLTLTGFAVVFATVQPLNVAALFATYITALLSHGLLTARMVAGHTNRNS